MSPMAVTAESTIDQFRSEKEKNKRGYNVYTLTDLIGVSGLDKSGKRIQGKYELPLFGLTIRERLGMFKSCSPIFGVVGSRMLRIAGLGWDIIADSKDEDRIADQLKDYKTIYIEYANSADLRHLTLRSRLLAYMQEKIPELLPDLSNFDSSLLRWKRKLKNTHEDRSTEIEGWLEEPSQGVSFSTFIKESIFDLLIHGGVGVYKEILNNQLENFYTLPGGTVLPLKNRYVGGYNAYVQMMAGFDPKIYFSDEIAYLKYMPISGSSYGMIPLEALINKVTESLLFDRTSAERADGTKPPEKLIVLGENSPFGDMNAEFQLPIDKEEQKRIETVVNEERKNAIRVISGVGTPLVVDASRADTYQAQMERQKDIKEDIALVFNASNLEMNLTGSDDTSGRSTSESQERLDQQKGIWPIIISLQYMFNKELIPLRFGTGYTLKFKSSSNELYDIRKIREKLSSGAWSVNELRVEDMGKNPFEGDQFDKPVSAQPEDLGAETSPMNVRML